MEVKMKALLVAGLLAIGLLMSAVVKASDVEEVIVVGANIAKGYSDPTYDNSIIEALDPTRVYQPGGVGGFVGATTHGTDTKHTSVYRNGIPVNDPGSGWYDFGTETPTFQSYTTISGPNSTLYGSSSMAGTIFIEDNFDGNNIFVRGGEDKWSVQGGTDWFHVSTYRGSNGSVKTDNTEEDWFENKTLKTKKTFGQWNMVTVLQDYKYDYDSCYQGWDKTDDCTQKGFKTDVSVRGDWLTVGYSMNDVTHNTGWSSKNERYFADANKEVKPGLIIGAQNHQEKYNDKWDTRTAVYANYNLNQYGFGYRFEEDEHIYRVGYTTQGFNLSLANSFRKPNLYERYGDDWTRSNPNLKPEKGKGAEASFKGVTAWYYEFSESIDYSFALSQYINAGSYDSKGIKYNKNIMMNEGNLNLFVAYIDSDRIRVPEYKTKVTWSGGSTYGFDYQISYVGQFEKGLEFDGRPIDDVSTFNLDLGYNLTSRQRIGFQIRDIFDRNFEILPDYSAGGREISLSFDVSL
jgi:outer membrane cobalamin receptor